MVGPEPHAPAELDLPDQEPGDGYDQLARALSRAGDQHLAIDTPSSLDLRRLSVAELRAERDRLERLLDEAPRDRARELARATARRAEADQALEQLTARGNDSQRQRAGMLGLRPQEAAGVGAGVVAVARQQADRAAEVELELRRHQQRRAGLLEANAHLGPAYRQVVRELAWQRRAAGLAAEHDPPGYLRQELGPVPVSTRGRRAWRQAAAAIQDYRRTYGISDPEQALGPVAASTTTPAPHSSQQHAGVARSGPPASSSRRPAMPRPHPARPRPGPRLVILRRGAAGRVSMRALSTRAPPDCPRGDAGRGWAGLAPAVPSQTPTPGQVRADGVTVVPARRVPDLLQASPTILGPERVA